MPDTLCEWGMAGLLALHERTAALVIVDVLSFSTAVDIAVPRGMVARLAGERLYWPPAAFASVAAATIGSAPTSLPCATRR